MPFIAVVGSSRERDRGMARDQSGTRLNWLRSGSRPSLPSTVLRVLYSVCSVILPTYLPTSLYSVTLCLASRSHLLAFLSSPFWPARCLHGTGNEMFQLTVAPGIQGMYRDGDPAGPASSLPFSSLLCTQQRSAWTVSSRPAPRAVRRAGMFDRPRRGVDGLCLPLPVPR